jgi:hypothetical protein
MSHFSVVVIGENYEQQLAPYHEFECTGRVDEYIQSVDITDEVRAEYEQGTRRMMILPSGEALSAYDNRFYREPTPEEKAKIGPFAGTGGGNGMSWASQDWGDGKGYQTRVLDLTLVPGAEEKELPYPEIMTFREFCDYWVEKPIVGPGEEPDYSEDGDHKWGWIEVNDAGEAVKVVRRTNPNAKWDWYSVGGRWTGYFPLRDGTSGETGSPGLMTPDPKANALEAHPDDIDAARKVFTTQEAIVDYEERLQARGQHRWGCVAEFGFDRDAYLKRRRRKALVPFAVVKDGEWYEKGKRGWWASVSDEKDENVWVDQVAALFDGLDPETTVTMVDCHI